MQPEAAKKYCGPGLQEVCEAVGIPPVITPRIVLDGDGRVAGIRRPGDPDYDTTPVPEFVIGHPR